MATKATVFVVAVVAAEQHGTLVLVATRRAVGKTLPRLRSAPVEVVGVEVSVAWDG